MDFSQVTDITIPEGSVIRIVQGETVLWEKSGWPSGYVKVEYLESTGTQWINTGYKLWSTTNWKFDIRFSYTSVGSKDGILLGVLSTVATYKYRVLTGSADLVMTMPTFGSRTIASAIQANTVYDLKCSNYLPYFESYLDGTLKNRLNQSATASGSNLAVFHDANTTYTNLVGRIYGLKLWAGDNESLVADLQPCVRLSDGKPGMYDLVRRQFFTNAGTGEFLIGPTIQIPDAYQPVQYLESTGTQYIDTGIEGKNGLDISAQFMSADILQTRILASSDGTKRLGLLASSTTGAIVNQYDTVNKVLSDYVLDTTTIHSLRNKNGILFYDGAQVDTATTATFTTGKNLYLFASNSTTVTTAYVKIYGAMISDNGALVRYFVPCYRKSDSVAGMYDIVNDVFYTNSGTGTFWVGPSLLPNEYQGVGYLRSTGPQGIDTGIATSGQRWVLETKFMYESFLSYAPVYAAYKGESYNDTRLILTNSDNGKGYINNCNVASRPTTIDMAKNQIITIRDAFFDCQVNGVTVNKTNTTQGTANDNYLYLFNSPALISNNMTMRIYYQRIWNNGEMARDFTPCYRRSDGKPGMYDVANGVFYTNDGGGEFEVGPNV